MTIDDNNKKLNLSSHQSSQKTAKTESLKTIASLAASIIVYNGSFIGRAALILLIPHLSVLWLSTNNEIPIAPLLLLNHACFLGYTLILTQKSLVSFGLKISLSPKVILSFLAIGLFQWLLYALPIQIVLPLLVTSQSLQIIALPITLFLSIPLMFLSLRLFLFPVPALLMKGFSLSEFRLCIYNTLNLSTKDKALPLRLLIAPTAISIFLSSLPLAISPDGRLIEIYYIAAALETSLWILASALSIAAGLTCLPDKDWKSANLDPYRDDRFKTILLKAPKALTKMLSPAFGWKLLAVALLIWTGNFLRLQSMAPAAEISILQTIVADKELTLVVELKDPSYSFRGFVPAAFKIAGETGTIIAPIPKKVTENLSEKDLFLGIPTTSEPITLKLIFETDRTAENLIRLQDLYLYYRAYQALPLTFKDATIIKSEP